jgi:hypothetical protein
MPLIINNSCLQVLIIIILIIYAVLSLAHKLMEFNCNNNLNSFKEISQKKLTKITKILIICW